MARRGEAWQSMTQHSKASKAMRGLTLHGTTWYGIGKAPRGTARHGFAMPNKAKASPGPVNKASDYTDMMRMMNSRTCRMMNALLARRDNHRYLSIVIQMNSNEVPFDGRFGHILSEGRNCSMASMRNLLNICASCLREDMCVLFFHGCCQNSSKIWCCI